MLVDPDVCRETISLLDESHFAEPVCQCLFRCLRDMESEGITTQDTLIVWDWLKSNGRVAELCRAMWGSVSDSAGLQILAECAMNSTVNVEFYRLRLMQNESGPGTIHASNQGCFYAIFNQSGRMDHGN